MDDPPLTTDLYNLSIIFMDKLSFKNLYELLNKLRTVHLRANAKFISNDT